MDMERPIQMLPGIGPARAARLQKLGLETADDLLRWFPRQYEDRRTVYPVEGAPVGENAAWRLWWWKRPAPPASPREGK